ncbi:MAG: ABC transporter ATP-binding protein [Nitrososphaerota archaeon]
MSRVLLDHITKIYGDKEKKVVAVDDLSLEIPEGTFVGLLGPSGCGKTTTLRILAGLEKPTKGKVYFDDEDVTNWEPKRRNIAMIFQFPVLYPSITVYENIALPLKAAKIPENTVKEKVKEVAEIVGVTQYLNMKPLQLDVATKQKITLAKTLIRDPTIFLLDEPLTILDPKSRIVIRTKLKQIQFGLKKSMVYVTHDQTEALTLSEKIAIMDKGKVLQYDTPENLYNRPKNIFVGWFIGNPGMNKILCDVLEEDNKMYLITDGGFKYDITFVANELRKFGPLHKIILGIRPEHILVNVREGVKAKCIQSEYIGNRVILHVEFYNEILKVRVPEEFAVNPGDFVQIAIPKEKIVLFDPSTGNLLI